MYLFFLSFFILRGCQNKLSRRYLVGVLFYLACAGFLYVVLSMSVSLMLYSVFLDFNLHLC
uniref:Uncharacterized protein n=1 Tax=Rhizophora mucronata TaxID=61149 RepID=A0A2P2R0Q1_RHIMU